MMRFADVLPHRARIEEIVAESSDTRTFVLLLEPPVPALDAARPGQFVMLSLLGHGEAAFTLSALPGAGAAPGTAVVTVRRVGALTGALFALEPGARVGLRGPLGRGFPDAPGEATLYVAGGCGLSPLKAAITRQLGVRPPGTPLAIVYGARHPGDRIHRATLAAWERTAGVHTIECVEQHDAGWRGRVGLVVDFLEEAAARIRARRAALCGPSAMLRRAAERLVAAGLEPTRIHLAVERYMKCGTGQCGHCYVDHRYVCTDGPVFSYAELRGLTDAFGGEGLDVRSVAC
jgi:NAD(P)H-flavin reductase